jgi:chromosome segregation ATPase
MLSALLSRLGLVRQVRYAKVVEDLRKTQSRVEKFTIQCESLRRELQVARERAEQAAKALKHAQQEAKDREQRAERLKADFDRKRNEAVEKLKSNDRRRAEIDQKRQTEFESLHERVCSAEKELAIARENLMAVEVKLDILEGAANILDARTRAVLADQKVEAASSR